MLSASAIPAAELLVAVVLSWVGLNIYKTLRDPKPPPAEGVMLDLGLVAVTAAVFWLSASLRIFY